MSGRRWLFGALDQTGRHPRPAQDMRVVELQPVQIELDRAPRVRGQQLGEVVGQLLLGQGLDLVIEALADAPDGTRVGVDGLGLQALELQVLKMQLVVLLERVGVDRVCGQGFHLAVTSWLVIERPLGEGDEATLWIRIQRAVSSA